METTTRIGKALPQAAGGHKLLSEVAHGKIITLLGILFGVLLLLEGSLFGAVTELPLHHLLTSKV